MDDLIAFLRAQVNWDELIAEGAACWYGDSSKPALAPHWREVEVGHIWNNRDSGIADTENAAAMPHIARHDPARVLADVAAKRRIIRKCEEQAAWESTTGLKYPSTTAWALAVTTLRLLALPYADHPEYREEWRP